MLSYAAVKDRLARGDEAFWLAVRRQSHDARRCRELVGPVVFRQDHPRLSVQRTAISLTLAGTPACRPRPWTSETWKTLDGSREGRDQPQRKGAVHAPAPGR